MSRMDQVKVFKSSLPQISLGPFLNTLSQITITDHLNIEVINMITVTELRMVTQKCMENGFYFPRKYTTLCCFF